MSGKDGAQPAVIRLSPTSYIHVLDNNTNVTRVVQGPMTFTRQEHERLVLGPEELIAIPPQNYVIVQNPIQRNEKGEGILTKNGEMKLRYGDSEVRLEQEPFPLYPGEKLKQAVTPLTVVKQDTALRLRADRDTEYDGTKRLAGDEFLCEGPKTYVPSVAITVVETIQASIILPNQALKLVARKSCVDRSGVNRTAGEEWIHRTPGTYLPGVDEQVLKTVKAFVLTDRISLHLRATRTFTDQSGKQRKAGEEWLVTNEMAETHIPDIYEEVVGKTEITTLSSRQYAVVIDPWKNDKQCIGQKELRKGECKFFLQPGERLEAGIQDVFVLEAEEALLLIAREEFSDKAAKDGRRGPGDRWMIYGPCDYVPPVEVEVIEKRGAIPLDENEGVYVRDFTTGKVRSVIGHTFMLAPNEELWEKRLSPMVERLLSKDFDVSVNRTAGPRGDSIDSGERDKTRVVSFRVPHNAAVQIYDYAKKAARVVFGPDLVMLEPDEEFTTMSLSGDKPKRPGVIKALALLLGPDFATDLVSVETADHARLSLQLSYNWHFEVDKTSPTDAAKLFQVPDFVGDSCKAIASRVRGAVASVAFDEFHKNSARIIRRAVFGEDANGKIGQRFFFDSNNLVITNVDIQSVEPVDQRTRDSLQKSVQLAIEITTKSQEAAAKQDAERREQAAKGKLERQKIDDEAAAEAQRKTLLELQAQSAAVESTGQAKAEATARAEAAQIEGKAAVDQARLKAEAIKIESENELEQMRKRHEDEITHARALNELEINKARELAEIEAAKFKQTVDALGADTICAMAKAGPEMQAKLLSSLNLSGMLITDGNSPINLFNTAQGLIGGPNAAQPGVPPQQ